MQSELFWALDLLVNIETPRALAKMSRRAESFIKLKKDQKFILYRFVCALANAEVV